MIDSTRPPNESAEDKSWSDGLAWLFVTTDAMKRAADAGREPTPDEQWNFTRAFRNVNEKHKVLSEPCHI